MRLYRKQNSEKIIKVLLWVIIVSLPLAITYCLVYLYLGAEMSDFVPVMSDEISYWHQIASFREAGFAGGYYTYNENPASASFAHYGAHGFLYPMMMASFSFFVGWNYSTVFFFNIAWYTFSLVVFLIYSRKMLNIYQLILIVLVILTFWSSHIYMSTGMRVVFFNGYSIILAALRPLHNLPPRSSKAHLSCIIDT